MPKMNRDEYREVAHRYNRIPKKLNAQQAQAIRKNVKGKTLDQLAAEYGVHRNTVHGIRSGHTWSHV